MNIDRLNINNGGSPTLGFSGDVSLISDIEKTLGFTLPGDYIAMLKQHDGGHPELDTYSLTQDNTFGVSKFYSIGNPNYETLENAISRWGLVLGKGMLPIARDGGDNQFYLDLNEATPSVWIYLHDENEARVKLANSLEEFIDGLNVNPDYL
ncbi:SMI1/KNR4 family protein [Serratia fonticola]|uniref:SMI1/KNR4 family protein n=1 Tax=Serratia fonticola TaxID=47917 RepID=UPI003BB7A5B2